MNRFHWHLTEDQGWRIEIKKYPKLTQIAAFRKHTLIGHYNDQPHQFDGQRYGGFYTQQEVAELVAYAEAQFITIIPEIELPGHSQAALAAYPQLACTEGPFEVATTWGIKRRSVLSYRNDLSVPGRCTKRSNGFVSEQIYSYRWR